MPNLLQEFKAALNTAITQYETSKTSFSLDRSADITYLRLKTQQTSSAAVLHIETRAYLKRMQVGFWARHIPAFDKSQLKANIKRVLLQFSLDDLQQWDQQQLNIPDNAGLLSDVKKLKRDLTALQKNNQHLRDTNALFKDEITALRKEIKRLADVKQQENHYKQKYQAAKDKISRLQLQIDRLKQFKPRMKKQSDDSSDCELSLH